ncbi:hypothetical protein B9Z65_6912 [Elsinoe australis]|uniref:tRNA pseudouridine(55) synthase n=1 Tax=Elsinoe australis TaxID=40998 RepID=A0A2P7Z411_9PEZI|nr:hypothetical protein B9Z65_6912 [Elsinoe australis]
MSASSQVLDGVFAVNKPTGMTSAYLCNEIKHKLTRSSLFAPAVGAQTARRDEQKQRGQKLSRKMRHSNQVKIGHGGTLDPAASGVISFGVGDGTKALNFLQKGAKKGYEAVLLFGAATDSFDMEGKVVGRKGWEKVTREAVEAKLDEFRGKVMQRPSVYSALSRGGMRMYEYARQGKEIPELEKREMFVTELEIVEWMDGGSHPWHWPAEEIEKDRKEAFVKALRFEEIGGVEVVEGSEKLGLIEDDPGQSKGKRKRESKGRPDSHEQHKKPRSDGSAEKGEKGDAKVGESDGTTEQTNLEVERSNIENGTEQSSTPHATDTPATQDSALQKTPCPAPAARIRMVVSSGFYVRSLCHDLGVAVGSLATMTSLKRTKQACFELGDNVIDYEDFDEDEDVWGPKVAKELNAWPSRFEELQAGSDPVE